MVDTRNAFEVEYGTFENALHFNIEKFTKFPAAISAHKEELANKTLVSFVPEVFGVKNPDYTCVKLVWSTATN